MVICSRGSRGSTTPQVNDATKLRAQTSLLGRSFCYGVVFAPSGWWMSLLGIAYAHRRQGIQPIGRADAALQLVTPPRPSRGKRARWTNERAAKARPAVLGKLLYIPQRIIDRFPWLLLAFVLSSPALAVTWIGSSRRNGLVNRLSLLLFSPAAGWRNTQLARQTPQVARPPHFPHCLQNDANHY